MSTSDGDTAASGAASRGGLPGAVRTDRSLRSRWRRADAGPSRRRSWRTIGWLTAALLCVIAAYVGAMLYLLPPAPGMAVSLDELSRDAQCAAASASDTLCLGVTSKVADATFLDEDARIVGTLVAKTGPASPQQFWTSYPKSDAATNQLLQQLISGHATVTVDSQWFPGLVRFVTQYILPLVLLANLFVLLFALIQGGSGSATSELLRFGRVGGRQPRAGPEVTTTFADVAAAEEAIAELAEVRDYLADPSLFAMMGALPPKGVLLFGPPGCGKTLLARAVAGEANAAFFAMSGSEFVEVLVGVGAARVRDLFRQARASAPAIVFIDEIDAVGRHRGAGFGQGHDEREQTLNELLAQMDGFSAVEGVVVLGATNRPDILDPALLRAGRFDRHVHVERPDLEGRLEILQLHASGRRLAHPESDLPLLARVSAGFTGADLANVLNEAALLAVRERAHAISRQHLQEAVDRVQSGPKRRGQMISAEQKRRIACHEAGHAVVAAALDRLRSLERLSIIARGRGIGHLAVVQEDQTVVTGGDMEARIAIAMAGFAAERLVFGETSSGSEQDVERATTIARDMAGRYGMSERLGPVRILRENREVFLGRDYLATRDVSQPTLEHLDAEVRRMLDERLEVAAAILEENRSVLNALMTALIERETLQGDELREALSGVISSPSARLTAGVDGTEPDETRIASRGSAPSRSDARAQSQSRRGR